MAIPDTGFLTVNTNQPPVDIALPVAATFEYGDGAGGTITTEAASLSEVVTRSLGTPVVSGEAGLVGVEPRFNVVISRSQLASVTLIDSIDPPETEPFTAEAGVDVAEEIEPCVHNFEVDDYEVCCEVEEAFLWLFNGDVMLDGSRKWGKLA